MESMRDFNVAKSRFPTRRYLAAMGLLAMVLGGCAASAGRSPLAALSAASDRAALEKAVQRDSFPTASQVGLASPPRR